MFFQKLKKDTFDTYMVNCMKNHIMNFIKIINEYETILPDISGKIMNSKKRIMRI